MKGTGGCQPTANHKQSNVVKRGPPATRGSTHAGASQHPTLAPPPPLSFPDRSRTLGAKLLGRELGEAVGCVKGEHGEEGVVIIRRETHPSQGAMVDRKGGGRGKWVLDKEQPDQTSGGGCMRGCLPACARTLYFFVRQYQMTRRSTTWRLSTLCSARRKQPTRLPNPRTNNKAGGNRKPQNKNKKPTATRTGVPQSPRDPPV